MKTTGHDPVSSVMGCLELNKTTDKIVKNLAGETIIVAVDTNIQG